MTGGDPRTTVQPRSGRSDGRGALHALDENPLAEGDYYPGDLLVAVLGVAADHWRRHPDQMSHVDRILAAVEALGDLQARDAPEDVIRDAIRTYRGGV